METKAKIAIYPGSFDPITYGHIDIINRAAGIFPELIVAVVNNLNKKTLFSLEEREEMLRAVIKDKENVKIDSFDGLLVDYVESKGSRIIVRGLRAISDFEYEFQMALSNDKLKPDVETVFMMSSEQYSYVSSRLIKEIGRLSGDVSQFVPDHVVDKLRHKLNLK